MNDLRTGLSYGDVLLIPHRSPVDSRSDVDLSTSFTPSIDLETPLVSAAMDTVTEADLAIALSQAGGLGVLHRFLTPDEQAAQVETVTAAAAITLTEVTAEFAGDPDALAQLLPKYRQKAMRAGG